MKIDRYYAWKIVESCRELDLECISNAITNIVEDLKTQPKNNLEVLETLIAILKNVVEYYTRNPN